MANLCDRLILEASSIPCASLVELPSEGGSAVLAFFDLVAGPSPAEVGPFAGAIAPATPLLLQLLLLLLLQLLLLRLLLYLLLYQNGAKRPKRAPREAKRAKMMPK